tara:strand:+ start:1097 stop:1237 length:141 start_codon:yes stop_codon:yes gene_type:complete
MHLTLNNSGLKIDANVSFYPKNKNYFKLYFTGFFDQNTSCLLLDFV